MINKSVLADLANFQGDCVHYEHPLYKLCYTEGARRLFDNADAYWFLDIIGSYQPLCKRDSMLCDFQNWRLIQAPEEGGRLVLKTKNGIIKHVKCGCDPVAYVVCQRDQDDVAIIQELSFTDFPFDAFAADEDGVRVWVENNVIMLPSER